MTPFIKVRRDWSFRGSTSPLVSGSAMASETRGSWDFKAGDAGCQTGSGGPRARGPLPTHGFHHGLPSAAALSASPVDVRMDLPYALFEWLMKRPDIALLVVRRAAGLCR